MNRGYIIGNLVRDPESRTTSSGLVVVNATVADNRRKKDGSESVSFIDITLWDKRGEAFARNHKKGDKVFVEGRYEMDSWEDKNGGGRRTKLKMQVENWEFVKGDAPARTASTPENF